jgi:NADPH-dependent curcumin reductase CurA
MIVRKRLRIRGFIVYDADMGPLYTKEHQEKLSQWIKDGTFKIKISVTDGISEAGRGLVGMLKGENFGKACLKIKDL